MLSFSNKIKDDVRMFYNNQIELNDIIYIENIHDFVTGIKPDRERLLKHIRHMNNEKY
jgi:hypothetical protein